VYFYASVNRETVGSLLKCLNEATTNCLSCDRPFVDLYIHSEGGDLYAGISAYSHVRRNKVPVRTIADGIVASSASLIYLGGAKRASFTHSWFLLHQISGEVSGKLSEMQEEVQNSRALMKQLVLIYKTATAMKKRMIRKHLRNECLWSVRDAVKHRLVQEVLAV
jgi:ATP-dependent protease ClpP protease subunit